MAENEHNIRKIFPEIIADYKGIFGDDLVSITMYGSATGKDYRPGKSDINFMIVLSESGIEHLDQAFSIVRKWKKRNVAIPLFLTETYIDTSMDVFPIEYLNFQRNNMVIFGKDILCDLSFKPEFIRLQCEREIKGKLLLLREAFIETEGKGKGLKDVISQSVLSFIAVFEALLYIKGKKIPNDKRGVIQATCNAFDIDVNVFERLLDIKEDKFKLNNDELLRLYKYYLIEVRKLSKLVDTLGD